MRRILFDTILNVARELINTCDMIKIVLPAKLLGILRQGLCHINDTILDILPGGAKYKAGWPLKHNVSIAVVCDNMHALFPV